MIQGGVSDQRGILYFAKGDVFVEEAIVSATQAKNVMPETSITLVTDRRVAADCFDNVVLDETPFEKADKPRILGRSPYDRTLYLDTDIWLAEPVHELFEVLDRFEMAMRPEEGEPNIPMDDNGEYTDGVPAAMPEYNSGVVPYRRTESVRRFLDDWEARCSPDHEWDQRSLRPALYDSDVRFTTLTTRYNCRYQGGDMVDQVVKVGHGPLKDRGNNIVEPRQMMAQLNATDKWRVFRAYRGNIVLLDVPLHRKMPIVFRRLRKKFNKAGFRGIATAAYGVVARAVVKASR